MDDSEGSLRDLLTRVARGDLDPAAAAGLLDERPGVRPDEDRVGREMPRDAVAAVRIEAGGVRLSVVGDPSVATAVADGPHRIRQDGGVLVLETPGPEGGGDGFEVRLRWRSVEVGTGPTQGSARVAVRVNPALPLTLALAAGKADVRGTRAPLDVECRSGKLTVTDHVGAVRGKVTTGSARVEAVFTGPEDSLSCDMGSLEVRVLPGSDTTVSAGVDLGSLKLLGPGAASVPKPPPGSGTTTATVGGGHGALAIAVTMGSAKVTLP